jgi:hypothetical protein
MNARRFALLARRPEFLLDRRTRAEYALADDVPPGALHLLDAAMVIGASELDRLCASAVAIITAGKRPLSPLLDVLGHLDPDRILAMYWALPPERREAVMTDPVWAYHVHRSPDLRDEEANIRDLIDETPTSEVGYSLARADVG